MNTIICIQVLSLRPYRVFVTDSAYEHFSFTQKALSEIFYFSPKAFCSIFFRTHILMTDISVFSLR